VRNHYFLIFMLLAFICGVIFPWRDGFGAGYFAHQRIVQIILLLFIAISVVWRASVLSLTTDRSRLGLGGTFFYVGGLLSVFMAGAVVQASLEYLHWLLLGILFVSCVGINDYISVRLLGAFFLISHAVLVFLAVLYLAFAFFAGDQLRADVIYPATENIRFFNQIQIFVLPLLFLLLKRPRFEVLANLFFLANVLLICIGGARGAALCLLFLFVWGQWLDRSLKELAMRGVLLSGGAILIYIFLWLFEPIGLRDLSRSGTSGRLDMWIDLILRLDWHHLLWGIGPANYALLDDEFIFGHPHNSVLQWILEWGGLSFIGLAIVVSHIIIKSFKYLESHPDDLVTKGLFLSSSSALAYSLVDGVIVMPIAQTLLIIFLGLLFGRIFQGGETSSPELQCIQSSSWRSLLIGIVVLLITVPYVYLASQYYLQQSASYQEVVGPRFWINGVPLRWPD
jgi:hypothetical protein